MKKAIKIGIYLLNVSVTFLMANMVAIYNMQPMAGIAIIVLILWFVGMQVVPSVGNFSLKTRQLRRCKNGCELIRIFLFSVSCSVIYVVMGWQGKFSMETIIEAPMMWLLNTLVMICVEAIVFWNGIIRMYLFSRQLGIRWRVVGIACGWIPIVNVLVLMRLLKVVEAEVKVEQEKLVLNRKRNEQQICKTKYPILMVHGVFFRDFRYLNYWGRIPEELEKNGATIFYGNHQSASSVEDSAKELMHRIKEIVQETGCEKVNIIAHSKGGLDCRYAIALEGAASFVASLTTINTPHRGCEFADYLLSKIPQKQQESVAKTYNSAMEKLGDANPDFLAAVYDLTAKACQERNIIVKDVEGVYYQSVGSKLNRAMDGRFPLNFTYQLVNYFDGNNDGLVGEASFPWGEHYELLTVKGNRGISHGDMIDLNRENIEGFDVREYFVTLVQELKRKGF